MKHRPRVKENWLCALLISTLALSTTEAKKEKQELSPVVSADTATVEKSSSSPFLSKSKAAFVEKFAESKILDAERAKKMGDAPIYIDKLVKGTAVRLKGPNEVEFVVQEGLMDILEKRCKERFKENFQSSMTAEAFLMEMANMISQADLLLVLGDQAKIDKLPVELREGLALAQQANTARLFLNKNLSLEEYAKSLGDDKKLAYASYMTSGTGLEFLEDPFSNNLYVPRYAGVEELLTLAAKASNDSEPLAKKGSADASPETVTKTAEPPVAENALQADPMDALFTRMRSAKTREDFQAVLPEIAKLDDPRKFDLVGQQLPSEIPFDELTSSQAQQSTLWYTSSQAEVRPNKEYLEFYRQKLVPEYKAFFKKIAKGEKSAQFQLPLETQKNGNNIIYYVKLNKDIANKNIDKLFDKNFFNVLILDPVNIQQILSPKAGSHLKLEATMYYLAPGYKSALPNSSNGKSMKVYLYCTNKEGKLVDRGSKNIFLSPFQRINGESLMLHGWGLELHDGRIFLNNFAKFTDFHFPPNPSEDKKIASFELATTPPETRFPDTNKAIPKANKIDGNGQVASNTSTGRNPSLDSPEGIFYGILLVILATPWLALPFMIYVLVTESKRKFKQIPLPEDFDPESFDKDNVAPELQKISDFLDTLETKEIEGENFPVYTHRKEINKGYALLREMEKLEDKTPETICCINDFGVALNGAQKRYMNGSKWLLTFVILIFVFIGGMMMATGSFFAGQIWMCVPFIYYLSLKTPTYKLANPEPGYYRAFQAILKVLGVGSLFAAVDMANTTYATIYKDQYGNRYVEKDYGTGCFIAMIMLVVLITFSPFILLLNCIINLIRNYAASK